MESELIEKLFNVLDEVVRAEGRWAEKKVAILGAASDDQRNNLHEFLTWFDEEDAE